MNDNGINLMYLDMKTFILWAADESILKFHSVQENKHTVNIWWTIAFEIAVEKK